MAHLFESRGDIERALELYKSIISVEESNSQKYHPNTLSTLQCTAEIYVKMKDYDAAAPIFENVLRGREATFGQNHHETLLTAWHIGLLSKMKGETTKAVTYLKRARDGFGEGHANWRVLCAELYSCELLMLKARKKIPKLTKMSSYEMIPMK